MSLKRIKNPTGRGQRGHGRCYYVVHARRFSLPSVESDIKNPREITAAGRRADDRDDDDDDDGVIILHRTPA